MRSLPALLLLVACAVPAQAPEPSLGQLLYANHCGECHSVQMHWRAHRRARDWDTLRAQVRRWQGEAHLDWNDEEVDAVVRHLNDTIYHFPPPRSDTADGAAWGAVAAAPLRR